MSGEEVNPFAQPSPKVNTQPNENLDDYNPFAQRQGQQQQPISQNLYAAQPTVTTDVRAVEPQTANTQYGGNYAGQDDTMKARQEELERKEAELTKREQDLKGVKGVRENNFPPVPSFCCVGPCFYHDISIDIPIECQKTCKMMFIVWQLYVFCLFFNCITGLAALCVGYSSGPNLFGVGLLYFILFTPCSFIFWYRPIYKALKSGSSFNYMIFFFIFFFQTIFTLIYALGISFLGTCGWINGAGIASSKVSGKEAVAAMFFVSGALFTLLGIIKILLLRKIHTFYRRSGASFEKAQSEFTQGVASNKNVQSAAVEAVKASVSDRGTRY